MGVFSENFKKTLFGGKGVVALSAEQARNNSMFGSNEGREKYLEGRINDLLKEIASKPKGDFSHILQIEEDDNEVLQDLVDYFKGEGYGVFVLDNRSNPALGDIKYLTIAWKTVEETEEVTIDNRLYSENIEAK